jgi:hypothetical protein
VDVAGRSLQSLASPHACVRRGTSSIGWTVARAGGQRERCSGAEAQCEAEREAKIKPLREMEIAGCKADPHNDAAFCERFWKDYGNAVRSSNGTMVPGMFGELPVALRPSRPQLERLYGIRRLAHG